MTVEQFMARAIELGRAGLHAKDGHPFAAVIVKEGTIVGEGRSQQKTLYDPTAHGEIVAIHDACKRLGTTDLSGCEIYITTCEPCLRAARACRCTGRCLTRPASSSASWAPTRKRHHTPDRSRGLSGSGFRRST